MDNTINGRTLEEIKRSLKCRAMWGTPDSSYLINNWQWRGVPQEVKPDEQIRT